jgi:hypothetical protein
MPGKKEPTHDSPQERDDKADDLAEERAVRAATLAVQLTRFRWEVRFYYLIVLLVVVTDIL